MVSDLNLEAMESTADSPPSRSSEEAAMGCAADWECEREQLVKSELEAAEALAVLSYSAMLESQRVKSESPAGTKPEAKYSARGSSDPAEDQDVVVQPQCKTTRRVMMKSLKVKQDAEAPKQTPSFGGNKSREKLTEDEKEARRVHRILANRESARKTIRRRQVLYEELSKKATYLAWENEDLNREKELAVKLYDSLKNTNESLKAQMATKIKTVVKETRFDSKSIGADVSPTSCTNFPFFIYNQLPFTHFPWTANFPWSTIIQSPNLHQYQSPNLHQSPNFNFQGSENAKPESFYEQKNLLNINASGTPFYIPQYPWLFPFPGHGNGIQPRSSFDQNADLNVEQVGKFTYCNQLGTCSSPKMIAYAEDCHTPLSIDVKTKASSSTETKYANPLQFGLSPYGSGMHAKVHPKGVVLVPAPTMKHGTGQQAEHTITINSRAGCLVNALTEMKYDPSIHPSKKEVDNVATEARMKRKEVIKSSKKEVDKEVDNVATEARMKRKEVIKLKRLRCH